MIHKRPDFLAVVCFGSSPTPCLNSPVRKLKRRHTERLRKRDNVLKGEGEGVWKEPNHTMARKPGPL
jgi:hypothetical protein